jgi:hypothetical protein
MTLRLALCFLFHQHLGEPAARASRIVYRGLLDALHNHSRLKINLMLSGTLCDALCWFDAPLLQTVRRGVEEGRFRLLGSTYAQNLLPACDDGDNRRQIELHRSTLNKYFGAEPAAFWAPHRAWTGRIAPYLADAGYRILPLEGRTLQAAGACEPRVFSHPGADLRCVWDDAPARARFTYAAWYGRETALRETLAAWRAHPAADRLFPVISEDAAAFGLWGYDAGLDPRADLIGLDRLLDSLEREENLELAFLEDAPAADSALDREPDGWGEDLDRVLAEADAPLHEEGYTNWADFSSRAPKLKHFRRIHSGVRARLCAAERILAQSGSPEPGRRLFALAGQTYCAHQAEFGAPGAGGRGDPVWEGVCAAIAVAKAAELACGMQTPSGGMIDDLTGDGEDEILLGGGGQAAILSVYGGRLLFWVDVRSGSLHIGNPLPAATGSLYIEAQTPDYAPVPDDWLPAGTDPLGAALLEPPPGRRCNRLARAHLPTESDPLPYWPRPQSPKLRPALPVRRRALNDFLSLDDGSEEPSEPRLDFRLAKGAVTFLRFFGYRLEMTKRIRLIENGLRVVYRFRNANSRPVKLRLRTVSELCPDYQTALDSPGQALAPVRVGPRGHPGILNLRTNRALVCRASRHPDEPAIFHPGVLAWEVEQTFALTVAAGRTEMLILRWNLQEAGQRAQGVLPDGPEHQ